MIVAAVGSVLRNPVTGACWFILDVEREPGQVFAVCTRAGRVVQSGECMTISPREDWHMVAAPVWHWPYIAYTPRGLGWTRERARA